MVVGAFPAAKLGALLLKQISKPIANVVKNQAKSSPVFRKYVCMPPAQFYNWCEVKAKMWILNLGKPVNIPVLNEAMAIELGANLLGEGIIFVIAAGILISEYTRSVRKETAKEEAKLKEMEQLHTTIRELFIQSEEQGAHIRELTRKMAELDTKLGMKHTPNKPETTPKDGDKEKILPVFSPKLFSHENLTPQNLTESIDRENENTPKSFILKTVTEIENEFWNYPLQDREDGVLTLGLYYLSKNIIRL